MDEDHLWAAVRYVQRNPVRACTVPQAEAYRWSSAAAHCALRKDPLLDETFPEPGTIEDWSHWLREKEDAEMADRIRRQTHTGPPAAATVSSGGWKLCSNARSAHKPQGASRSLPSNGNQEEGEMRSLSLYFQTRYVDYVFDVEYQADGLVKKNSSRCNWISATDWVPTFLNAVSGWGTPGERMNPGLDKAKIDALWIP